MKNSILFVGLLVAFLCVSQRAGAQYAGGIYRSGDGFTDQVGLPLSDAELADLIGPDIYRETVVGARKQYNAGHRLIIGGASAMGSGLVTVLCGAVIAGGSISDVQTLDGKRKVDEDQYLAGCLITTLGSLIFSLGSSVLSVGIPLKIIGRSRLNWVENDYNDRKGVTYQVGVTPSGVGLALNF